MIFFYSHWPAWVLLTDSDNFYFQPKHWGKRFLDEVKVAHTFPVHDKSDKLIKNLNYPFKYILAYDAMQTLTIKPGRYRLLYICGGVMVILTLIWLNSQVRCSWRWRRRTSRAGAEECWVEGRRVSTQPIMWKSWSDIILLLILYHEPISHKVPVVVKTLTYGTKLQWIWMRLWNCPQKMPINMKHEVYNVVMMILINCVM